MRDIPIVLPSCATVGDARSTAAMQMELKVQEGMMNDSSENFFFAFCVNLVNKNAASNNKLIALKLFTSFTSIRLST